MRKTEDPEREEAIRLLNANKSEDFNGYIAAFFHTRKLDLTGLEFENRNLPDLNLDDVIIDGASFTNCALQGLTCRQNRISGIFKDCKLNNSTFEGADLKECLFENSDLTNSNFEGVIKLKLSRCVIKEAKFSPRCRETFISLSRQYTGHNFLIVLFFTFLSLAPFILEAAFWSAIGEAQSDPDRNASLIDGVSESSKEGLRNLEGSISEGRSVHVWKLVLGLDEGVVAFILTILLLLYNVLRGAITVCVNNLQKNFERSFRTPSNNRLRRIRAANIFIEYLSYIALLAAIIRVGGFMAQTVVIP